MGNKPTHKAFFVQELNGAAEAKAFWRQIGVAWAHKSGKGFSLKLDLVPADFTAGELVVLEATEKPEEAEPEKKPPSRRRRTTKAA